MKRDFEDRFQKINIMSKLISKILLAITLLLSAMSSSAQIKNATTEIIKISGNCAMCKATIEKAGNVKKAAKVDWNQASQMATLTYDSNKTNANEILKRIALAGYDNEAFLAPDDAYAKLPGCCQYDRILQPMSKAKETRMEQNHGHHPSNHGEMSYSTVNASQDAAQLQVVFDGYFLLKDALINTDADAASSKATTLAAAIKAVEMDKLTAEEHTVWMKVMKNLAAHTEKISRSKDVSKQREAFALLSPDVYGLMKVSERKTPVYYQHCPMYNKGQGANWLSKEDAIKNPYYGSKMMTCGSTVETLD